MPNNGVDPAGLAGDALVQWYRRRTDDLELERRSAAQRRFESFFGRTNASLPQWVKDPSDRSDPLERQRRPAFAVGIGQVPPRPSLLRAGDHTASGLRPRSSLADPAHASNFGFQGTRTGPWFRRSRQSDDALDAALPPYSNAQWLIGDTILNSLGLAQPESEQPSALAIQAQDCKLSATPRDDSSAEFFGFRPQSTRPSSKTPPGPDPAKTEVFKRGPDGKLHPVSGWHTTGPFDFSAWSQNIDGQGVVDDLTKISVGALAFMEGGNLAGGLVEGLGFKIGPDVVSGIINGHHSFPKFMGGPQRQNLSYLYSSIHRMFHRDLAAAFKQSNFPRIGGKGGGASNWEEYFIENPAKWDEAVAILRRTTREFDRKNGTMITKYLDETIARAKPPTKKPPN